MSTTLVLSDRVVDLDTGRITGPDQAGELRPMELKVLRHLLRHAGRVVSHEELLVEVWGYSPQARTGTVYTTLSRLRDALERDGADPRHVVTLPKRGVRLLVATEAPEPRRQTFAATAEALVGRTPELGLLASTPARLVTLVGPGGAGKTRLAREHAGRVGPTVAGGAWFCDWTRCTTLAAAADAVAGVLDVPLVDPVATIGEALAARGPILVVLDNAESVIAEPGAVGTMLAGWLRAAPEARFVVTSREPLRVAEEQRIPVGPLELPVAERFEGEAAELLLQRIRMVDPRFDPAAVEPSLVALLRMLDGLPLALEIAAPHLAVLGADGVLAALRADRTLTNRRAEAPDRHRSLRDVVEWSWERLPAVGRSALTQLLAFAGSFSIERARQVVVLPAGSPSLAELVVDLVERGLCVAAAVPGRFAVLGVVRAILGPPEPAAIERHTASYATLAAETVRRADGIVRTVDALVSSEADELSAAAGAALERPPVVGLGELLDLAIRTSAARGRWGIANDLANRALQTELPPAARVRVEIWLAEQLPSLGQPDLARQEWERLPADAAREGLPQLAMRLQLHAALGLWDMGDADGTARALERAQVWEREIGARSPRLAAWCEGRLALVRGLLNRESGIAELERAVERLRRAGDPEDLALAQHMLGNELLRVADPAGAQRLLREALDELPAQLPQSRAAILTVLARACSNQGRHDLGLETADEAVQLYSRLVDKGIVRALLERGRCRRRMNQLDEAAADTALAWAWARRSGDARMEASVRALDAMLANTTRRDDAEQALLAALEHLVALRMWSTGHWLTILLTDRWALAPERSAHPVPLYEWLLKHDLDLTHSYAAEGYAELLRATGRPGAALEVMRDVERRGQAPRRKLHLAFASHSAEQGFPEPAVALLGRPPPADRDDWERIHRARCYRAIGRPEAAEAEIAQVTPDPGEGMLIRALAELRGSSER